MTQTPLQFVAEEIQREIEARIVQLLGSDALSRAETTVLFQLRHGSAWSLARSIPISQIRHRASYLSDRAVKLAVKGLIETHGVPIGSSRMAPHAGYFFIVSDEDAEIAAAALQSNILSMFRRMKILAPRSAFVRKLNGQIEMLQEAE